MHKWHYMILSKAPTALDPDNGGMYVKSKSPFLSFIAVRSILAHRIHWRFPPSTAGEAPYTSEVHWHQPAWCTSDTPTIDRFHWSSQYLTRRHLPPAKSGTGRHAWRQTFSIPSWLAVRWLKQIANDWCGGRWQMKTGYLCIELR